ncbi:MAG TPA: hypothetical protein VFQ44_14215 [Streptosporangiaceae bacterium]|nr:hypothetical protein [Streptosporangiaceae bacterium]
MYAIVTLGLRLVPAAVSMWVVPAVQRPATTAIGTYRAGRLTAIAYGLAWAPLGAFVGILIFSPIYGSTAWLAGTLLLATGCGAWIALMRGQVPAN